MSGFKRSKSRELNLQLLFWSNFEKNNDKNYELFISDFKEHFEKNDFEIDMDYLDKEYALSVLKGIRDNKKKVDDFIQNNLKNWTVERLPKIDLCILELSVFEMCFIGIHHNIVINEALELSKKYSTDKSRKYINGVLNSLKEVKVDSLVEE